MVRAILEGRKTQTRRIIKLQPVMYDFGSQKEWAFVDPSTIKGYMAVGVSAVNKGSTGLIKNSYNVKGGLWVRENFYIDIAPDDPLPKTQSPIEMHDVYYPADARGVGRWCCQLIPECSCAEVGVPKMRPSIYMPRWACRLELEITGVRVERLNDISKEDALAEGVMQKYAVDCVRAGHDYNAKPLFKSLWERINGKGSWAVNPWVWALTFQRIT